MIREFGSKYLTSYREQFRGEIGRTFKESTPWWPDLPRSHDGEAPNVVVILFDDTGFSHLGCYGSNIDTKNIDALASNGLRYSNFHTTALCSPTRASLLTGRNHHAVGMRGLANYDTGFPNMRGAVSKNAATLGEILQESGYATFAVGKWHLNPVEEASAAGPFDDWPLQRGFDRYYGFLGGATDQFYPELTYDNHHVYPPTTPEDGYHLTEDLIDHSIKFINDQKSIYPKQPFFLYMGLSATHSPHQAPRSYIDKYKGRFDAGWDHVRDEWFAKQLELGIVPAETKLAPRNPGVDSWSDLSENAQKLALKLQESFAGFLDHTDDQIGRLVGHLSDSGELDNTIFLVLSDNGASQEGGAQGVSDEGRFNHPLLDNLDTVDSILEEIGSPVSSPNYPWGWAQAGNTPLKWYKSTTHAGGVRDPLIVHWPAGIKTAGEIRDQFTHVTDIVPTILNLLSLDAPESYKGIPQIPVTGESFVYTFEDRDIATERGPQYFEMFGHRAIWADNWKAVSRHRKNDAYSDDDWELYNLSEDFSECNDLSNERPEKLRELIDIWWIEAEKNDVLPLDDRSFQLLAPSRRPGAIHENLSYRYVPPLSRLTQDTSPPMGMGEWTLRADIERDQEDQGGVIFARGKRTSGLSLFIQDNFLAFDYNAFRQITKIRSDIQCPTGRFEIIIQMTGSGIGGTGEVSFEVNGEPVGGGGIPLLIRNPGGAGGNATSIGADALSPVTDSYEAPFSFTGKIHKVEVEIQPYATGSRLVSKDSDDIYATNL